MSFKYRSKETVQAVRLPHGGEVPRWFSLALKDGTIVSEDYTYIKTSNGYSSVLYGDYIVRDGKGDLFRLDSGEFEARYEKVD